MSESNLEGIDAVLSDRLKELGLDYVANVLEGKRQPSASQLMFLRTGHTFPLRRVPGTLLVGGSRDGEHVGFDPDVGLIKVPVPMNFARPYTAEEYRLQRIRVIDRDFCFYLLNGMEAADGMQALLTNYRSPNSVEHHEPD